MPQALVYVAAWVGNIFLALGASTGVALAAYAATYAVLEYATVAFLLNKATALLEKRPPREANRGLEVSVTDSGASGFAIYGTVRASGINKIPPLTANTDGRFLDQVLEIALHEVDSYQDTFAFDDMIRDAEISALTGSDYDDGLVASGKYLNALWLRRMTGTSTQAADYRLRGYYPSLFDTSFRGRGRAYVAITYDWADGKLYAGGLPPMTFVVNGAKVYDPRKDSTNGGTGAHRLASPSTWEYSCNPALGWAWYTMSDMGGRVASTAINWPSVIAAANVCDIPVVIPDVYSMTVGAGCSIVGNTITKTSGGATSWDASVRSTNSITSGTISGRIGTTSDNVMIGLNTDPTTDNNFTSIDYAMYWSPGNGIYIYESGSSIGQYQANYTTDTVLRIDYDGTFMRYYIDGKHVRTVKVPTAGAGYYFDSSLYQIGASVTLHMQHQYTFNGRFMLVRDWRDNARMFVDAMLGRMVRRGKTWYIYAGAYDAPVINIDKGDWLSIESIKTVAPRDGGRWNTVRCWYTDPKRNWQREECYPRRNATYKSADGAEEITLEMEQPACTDEYEAQRKAEYIMRQSRNQIAIVGRLPPRLRSAATGENSAMTFDDFGWADKIMRLRAMDLLPDGSVKTAAVEEQAADWTPLTASEYNAPSVSPIPDTNPTTPTAPSSFTVIENVNGTLTFKLGTPIVNPSGTRQQVIRSTNSRDASVGTIIYEGSAFNIDILTPNSLHWYYSRCVTNSFMSPYQPNTFGLGALPADVIWTAHVNSIVHSTIL